MIYGIAGFLFLMSSLLCSRVLFSTLMWLVLTSGIITVVTFASAQEEDEKEQDGINILDVNAVIGNEKPQFED